MKIFAILCLIAIGSIPNLAHAQQLMNFITRTTIPIVIQCPGCNARNQSKNVQGKSALSSQRLTLDKLSPSPPSSNLLRTLSYRFSESARLNNVKQFIEKARATDASSGDELERIFTPTAMRQIDAGMKGLGLSSFNVADAYALYWTSAWLGTRGRDDNLPSKQMIAVRNQAAQALLSTPEFTSASDEQKQEMAEALMVQAALIDGFVNGGKQDAALMSKVKAVIAQGAKAMGLDLYAMTLTPNGFVPAKKGSTVDDAIPPSPGEDAQALASNTRSDDAPNYALIAAAGGAGLGGMFLLGKAMGRKS
jgi:hypothetical protein